MPACCSVGRSSAGVPGLRCWDQLQLLQEELAAYSPHLSALPAIILANKVELLRAPKATITALRRRTQLPVSLSGCCGGCTCWGLSAEGPPRCDL